jgi:hypothetical protein
VLLHDIDFSDLSACTFWMSPGQALSAYTMRSHTTKPWANATLSVYAATTGPEQWTRLDNVSLQRTPGAAATGTECVEPGVGPSPDAFAATWIAASSASVTARFSGRTGAASAGFASESVRALGFTTLGDLWDISHTGWRSEAWATRTALLWWDQALDLTSVASASLTFESWLSGTSSVGAVQVSSNGVTWRDVAVLPPTNGWTVVGVDLSAFVGQFIYIRFAFDTTQPALGVEPDAWKIDRVSVSTIARSR